MTLNNPMKNKITAKRVARAKRRLVNQYSLGGGFINSYNSAINIEESLGFFRQNISACCRGESKTSHGYVWRHENDTT